MSQSPSGASSVAATGSLGGREGGRVGQVFLREPLAHHQGQEVLPAEHDELHRAGGPADCMLSGAA